MKLWYTTSATGIFNHSYDTGAVMGPGGCRVVVFAGVLFCVFRAKDLNGAIQCITRPLNTQTWSAPATVPLDKQDGQLPDIFVFKDKVYAFQSGNGDLYQDSSLAVYDRESGTFQRTPFKHHFDGTPSIVEFKGYLHVFLRVPGKNWIMHRRANDLADWRAVGKIESPADNVTTIDDPVAIAYQGLIHVFYKDEAGRTMLVKHDGENAWTVPRVFITQAYAFMPAVTIHNGLLKLVFSRGIPSEDGYPVYQYAYDGNSLSPLTMSSNLRATERVGLGVLGTDLVLVYRGV